MYLKTSQQVPNSFQNQNQQLPVMFSAIPKVISSNPNAQINLHNLIYPPVYLLTPQKLPKILILLGFSVWTQEIQVH